MELYERFRWAEILFADGDYFAAARWLEELLHDAAADPEAVRHGTRDARELLARAYFHSARLGPAEETARALLSDDPTDAYAAVLLYRSLQRQARHSEAMQARRFAAALGAPADTVGAGEPAEPQP